MSKVAIQGNASGTGTFTIAAPNSNTDRTLTLPDEAGTVVSTAGATFTGDVSTSAQFSTNAQGSTSDPAYAITSGSLGVNGIYAPAANSLAFVGGATERMRIDSSGYVLFGCTALPNSGNGGAGFETGLSNGRSVLQLGTTTTITLALARFYNPNGAVGSITTSGSSTAYNTSSDYRLKENVVDMTGAIDRVKTLKPSQFNFIADPDTTVDGFIAHEVQSVVPEAVSGEKDAVDDEGNPEYQGIDQSKLVPLLTGALKEAIARIETLEAEVATLKGASA